MDIFKIKKNLLHLITLVIVVSLFLPVNLTAKPSAELLIKKNDQQLIKGKLINVDVEEKSLVLESQSNGGIKIYMNEIDTIMIKRKKSVSKGFLLGTAIGLGLGLILYSDPHGEMMVSRGTVAAGCGLGLGLLGMLDAAVKSKYKKIQVKDKSPGEIKKILQKLKKKAILKN